MKIFLDSVEISEIELFNSYNIIDGITTNPTLISGISKNFTEHIKKICDIMQDKPVSVQVISNNYQEMQLEAVKIADIAPNIVVKIPLTWPGIKLCQFLYNQQIPTNVTLCFSVNQALIAAKAGANYISPFIGRLDDISISGIKLIEDIKKVFNNYNIKTKILAASIRTVEKISDLAIIGPDIITISPNLLQKMLYHDLTESGLKKFTDDWRNAGLNL